MINNTLWDGNTIDLADCMMPMRFDSYMDWCSDFMGSVHQFIRNGFNVYSTKFKNFVVDIRDCGSFEPKDKLEMTFIGLKEDVFTNNNARGFVEHIETDYDDDVYKLSIPTFYNMSRAAGKHTANCLHWLEVHSQYMLPLTIDEITMVKMLKAENPYDKERVEKAYLHNELRKKCFDLVFWYGQYWEWKEAYDVEYTKADERFEQFGKEHKDEIESCVHIFDKIFVNGKEVDELPEVVKEYERLKEERYAWWDESNFFNDLFKKLKKNLTREEILEALKEYYD